MDEKFRVKHAFEQRVKETIEARNLIPPKVNVVVGFSGGSDSTALLFALNELKEKLQIELFALHVNHLLREAADADEERARDFAHRLGVQFILYKKDIKELAKEVGLSVEETGRAYRYQVLDEAARGRAKGSEGDIAAKIATAHHADDQAETILMRILRGTGGAGLSGMAYSRQSEPHVFRTLLERSGHDKKNLQLLTDDKDRRPQIIRPLLDMTKAEIYEYCAACDLPFSEDETNKEADVFRNKIRLELIPYLKENYNENIMGSLSRLAKSAAADNDFLDDRAASQSGSLRNLQSMPDAIFYRYVVSKFAKIGLDRDIEMVHVEALRKMLRKNVGNKICEFPHGFSVELKNKRVLFKKPQ
jgi:tRNA(Ile)-lysidine synthase